MSEMTAIEFLKARNRMCRAYWVSSCRECPLSSINNGEGMECNDFEKVFFEKTVAIVQKWAEEQPIKTRQSEFLKLYPNAVKRDSVINICPRSLGELSEEKCEEYNYCDSCRGCKRDYWLAEVEE